MGEYEPDDSRDVTLSHGEKGPEGARTGPRERQRQTQSQKQGGRIDEQQQEGAQAGGERAKAPGSNDDGAPETDQYAVNQPQTMPQQSQADEAQRREQAGQQSDRDRMSEGDEEARGYGGRGEIAEEKAEEAGEDAKKD